MRPASADAKIFNLIISEYNTLTAKWALSFVS